MKEGLNLLPSVAKFQASKIKLKKQIRMGMLVFLSFWILLILAIFIQLWFNNYSLKTTKNKYAVASTKYQSLTTSVVLSKRSKYQAKLVGQVLNERFEYGSLIVEISNFFPENVKMENFEIKNKKQFMIKGIVSGPEMDEIEDRINNINNGKEQNFSSAKLKNISISADGWKFEMEVNLK